MYGATIGTSRYVFPDLKTLMAKATPARSGDRLAGIAAASGEERVAAQYALADLPLATFLTEHVVPYESDEVTRLIVEKLLLAPTSQLKALPDEETQIAYTEAVNRLFELRDESPARAVDEVDAAPPNRTRS